MNNYTSIPLEGKKRYKVANAIGFSQVFSIVAFTVDDSQPNTVISRGATEGRINFEMEWLSDIVISSSTGTVYVNIAPVEKKQYGKGTINAAGGVGTVKIVKSMIDVGSTLYKWYYPPKNEREFEFSIGARETKNTKLTIKGEADLGSISAQLKSVGGFSTDPGIGKTALDHLAWASDMKKETLPSAAEGFKATAQATYQGISSTFKVLFG